MRIHVLSYKTCLDTKPVLYQDRFCIFYRSYKTGFVSKRVKGKTCKVSNTKFEASIRATKPKHWQSHITSETVKIFIHNEKDGLGTAQSRFCSRHKAGLVAVGLWSSKSQFGAAGCKTGFVSRQVLHLLSRLQNCMCPKTDQYNLHSIKYGRLN